MADLTTLMESPLAHLHARMHAQSGEAVALREVPFTPMTSLRLEAGSTACARVEKALGQSLPTTVGDTAGDGGLTALWLGPDEWLLVASPTDEPSGSPAGFDELVDALGDARGAVVDVSANRTILELSGPCARAVLEKGCPTDLHPRSFPVGRAITATLGPVPLLLWRTDEETYRLLPRSSFADYVARWTLDAMGEYAGAL